MSLGAKLILRFSLGPLFVAAILFIPAGSLNYWQGWAFIATIIPSAVVSVVYLYRHDPALLQRRMQTKEPIRLQKLLVRFLKLTFLVAFLLPGLDQHFGWSRRYLGGVPAWLCVLSLGVVLAGYLFVVWAMRVNSFASTTIQVEAGQPVISTGPYTLVRHPLYLGSVVMCLFLPLALGSYFAWPLFALVTPVYAVRLLNEEQMLRQQLAGYSDYCQRTRFRLVPFVW
jgi:protein-S-isoprenylcysteine O-methyltransferase Ste14